VENLVFEIMMLDVCVFPSFSFKKSYLILMKPCVNTVPVLYCLFPAVRNNSIRDA